MCHLLRTTAPLAALLAVLTAGGPARGDDFRCPDRGGPAWRELRTANI